MSLSFRRVREQVKPFTPLALARRARNRVERRRQIVENKVLWKFEERVTEHLWRTESEAAGLDTSKIGPVMEITDGCSLLLVRRHLIGIESELASFICRSKELTRKYCAAEGVRIPEGRGFAADEREEAVRYAVGLGCPVVTKPSDSDWGRGVSVNLRTEKEIRAGFRSAALWGGRVVIEEFVTGEHYRLLFFRGRLLSAVRRELASVTGDGSATVRALIERENRTRVQGWRWEPGQRLLMPIPTGKKTRAELARAELSLDSVPERGRVVRLSPVSNYQFGSRYTEVADQVHPDTVAALGRCCTRIGVQLAGVDVISQDPSSPEYAVNEINTGPLLLLHYAAESDRNPIRDILDHQFGSAA